MNLTDSQRRAIELRGVDLAVPASAGSGKTATLARRCVALLLDLDFPCDPRSLLVVTFTRAAAAELRSRIGGLIREEAARADSPERRALIRRQETLLDLAEIGTIDAWCGRLIREHFTDAAVDPGFRTLGGDEHTLLKAEVADNLLEWVYAADSPVAEAAREWVFRGERPDDRFFRNAVIDLDSFRDRLVNPAAWFDRHRALLEDQKAGETRHVYSLLASDIVAELDTQMLQIRVLISAMVEPRVRTMLGEYAARLDEWRGRLRDPTCLRSVAAEIDDKFILALPRGKHALPPADAQVVKRIREIWLNRRLRKIGSGKLLAPLLDLASESASLALAVLNLASEYGSRLDAAKRQRGVMAFGDVQRAALDLLGCPNGMSQRTPTALARRLQARYAHVLVDEFQDTSAVQDCLLRMIAAEDSSTGGRFLVGDIKQSIYGFRQADPGIMLDMIRRFEARQSDGNSAEVSADVSSLQPRRGCVVRLRENFRSHGRLIDGVNALMSPLMTHDFGGVDYVESEQLIAGRADLDTPVLDCDPRVWIERIDASGGNDTKEVPPDDVEFEFDRAENAPVDNGVEAARARAAADEVPLEIVEREAGVIARRIKQLIGDGARIPLQSAHGATASRELQYSDVVVLLRAARQNAPRLAAALRDFGVPAAAIGRESLLDSLEVSDVRCVLSLLVNRRNDVALAAFLRGPMVRLPDADLLDVRESAAGGLLDAVEAFLAGPRGTSDAGRVLAAAMNSLDRWTELARYADPAGVVARVIQESRLDLHAAAMPGAAFRTAMLAALKDAAVDSSNSGHSLSELVDHLDALEDEGFRPEIGLSLGGDVVRVMTIHAAKGLEFPVVFVACLGASFASRPGMEAVSGDVERGIGLRYFDATLRTELRLPQTLGIRRRNDVRMREEELRLFYVAATRARERLHLVGHAKSSLKSDGSADRAVAGSGVPLIDRLSATSVFDWIELALQATPAEMPGVGPPMFQVTNWKQSECGPASPAADEPRDPPTLAAPPTLDSADMEWVAAAHAAIRARPDDRAAHAPASLSVSGLKRGVEQDDDVPITGEPVLAAELPAARELVWPDAAADSDEGRLIGTATHRFLRFVDFDRLATEADAAAQAKEQVAAGRLPESESTRVPLADVVWLAGSPTGKRLLDRAARVRRELPFTFAFPVEELDEQILLRGVIDLLLVAPDGLTLVDYKTDQPRSAAQWRERVSAYTLQLQTYAAAAESIFVKPIIRLELVFLRARKIIDVLHAPERVASAIRIAARVQ